VSARILGKRNPHTLLVGMQASTTTLENNMELLKKLNVDLPYDPATPLLGIWPKECDSDYFRGTFTPMFIAALWPGVQTRVLPKLKKKDFHASLDAIQ
jgi:hypothetical protein